MGRISPTRPSCPHPQKGRTSNADTEKTLHTGGRFRVHNKLWVMRSRFLGCAAFLRSDGMPSVDHGSTSRPVITPVELDTWVTGLGSASRDLLPGGGLDGGPVDVADGAGCLSRWLRFHRC